MKLLHAADPHFILFEVGQRKCSWAVHSSVFEDKMATLSYFGVL